MSEISCLGRQVEHTNHLEIAQYLDGEITILDIFGLEVLMAS